MIVCMAFITFLIRNIFFQANNLLKENNVVNEESAVVHDNLLSGWTCNTTNSRGRFSNIESTYSIIFMSRPIHSLFRVMLSIRYTSINFFISPTEEISPMPPSSVSSGFSDDDSLRCDSSQSLTISQFVEYVLKKKRAGLIREYEEIKTRSFDGTFTVAKYDEYCLVFLCYIFFAVPSVSALRVYFTWRIYLTLFLVVVLCCRARPNLLKNRYTDVLCYDHTRVMLAESDKEPMSDYIHANFVDGYKQKNAFISTQGPLPHTCADFWRMVWEQQVLVIVMTTKVFECGKIKCEQYWPPDESSDDHTYQNFKVSTTSLSQFDNYAVTRLELTNTNVSIRCQVRFS